VASPKNDTQKKKKAVPKAGYSAHAVRGDAPSLSVKMLELLVCPRSHGSLVYDEAAQELTCKRSLLAYPVRDGVPILLESEARPIED